MQNLREHVYEEIAKWLLDLPVLVFLALVLLFGP